MEITILYEDTHTGKRPEWMALECNELLASSEGLKIMNIGGLEMEAEYKRIRRVFVNGTTEHPMAIAIADKAWEARNEVE